MKHFRGAEGVLEHVRRRREGLVDIAAPEPEIERDIGAAAALEVLEIREGAGRLELLVHQRAVLGGLDLVEHRRQLVVFGDDQRRRLLGDMRIGGEHDGNRLPHIMHLVDREDRLVVESRAVIGLRDDLANILGGDDAINPGHLPGCAHIDRSDAAVRDGAAENLAVQHPGKPHGMGVFGAPGDLVAPFEPRQGAADLSACGRGCHQWVAPLPSSAARTARPT